MILILDSYRFQLITDGVQRKIVTSPITSPVKQRQPLVMSNSFNQSVASDVHNDSKVRSHWPAVAEQFYVVLSVDVC